MQTKQINVRGTKAEPRARIGRPQISQAPVILLLAGPKAALLFWFFGDLRCDMLLFTAIPVVYKYENM